MGRGRAPCCAKVGLNKGSWTPEEDMKLMAHIHKHGHGNWRALPKLAGLLRCGKSCRLRWINYLRPDIKRGNFTEEEEETIIKLHELLGNKWSKIASFLPGRTDNEIKNVWNTHLKKRLAAKEQKPAADEVAPLCSSSSSFDCENSSAQVAVTPVEPNVDAWSNILDDASNSASSSSSTEPCEMNHDSDEEARRGGAHGSMSQEEAEEDALVIPDVVFDPDIWSMIEDDDASSFAPGMETTEGLHQSNRLRLEQKHNGQNNDSEWLKYLEEELGLRGAAMDDPEKLLLTRVEEEGDPVSSYFQKGALFPIPLNSIDVRVSRYIDEVENLANI